MIDKKSWQEFRASGLLWWINMILHTFGWEIVVNIKEDGTISEVYPARVKFRGFDEKSNTEGYARISEYLKENADLLVIESKE
ncbi:hypothetical protein [Desulfosporosinus sp. SB140]|uniref:hypothetical protein n=1 Tax=Desulfosporosinus paludis TaxID=3115649 RepID=UPI00388E356C